MNDVPVLVTYDVHVHAMHHAADVERYLERVLAEHDRIGLKASFLVPAEAARLMPSAVRALLREGHQVGCHGLTHREEYYDTMPVRAQEETLRRATREIEDVIQQRVTFFRAPVFKISGTTIRVLEELGYEADLSMNSQRLGILSSDVTNVTWLAAPRRPYHPSRGRAWRRGASKLWEIPLPCLGFPFMVNTQQVFGAAFMRAFFRVLHVEARISGGPIVYMLHPEDLCPARPKPARPRFRLRDLIPSRVHGFAFKYVLYETDPVTISRDCHALFRTMREAPGVRFVTVPEYVAELNRRVGA